MFMFLHFVICEFHSTIALLATNYQVCNLSLSPSIPPSLFSPFLPVALSVFVCGISAFLIRIVPAREGYIVILSSVFNGIAVFGWNALDVISTSAIYPVHLR